MNELLFVVDVEKKHPFHTEGLVDSVKTRGESVRTTCQISMLLLLRCYMILSLFLGLKSFDLSRH